MAVCPNCNGRGKIYGPPYEWEIDRYWKKCPSCNVTGQVQGSWRKCDDCGGWGEVAPGIDPVRCPVCNGVGILPSGGTRAPRKKRAGRSIHIHLH